MPELMYRVFVTRKMVVTGDDKSLYQAEGERIHNLIHNVDILGVIILNDEFMLTVERVKRLERLLGSVFNEKVQVVY